jgi:hypothetical protein
MEKNRETATETRIVAALVVVTTIDGFDQLKQTAEQTGCRIVFQKTAPPWAKLWIVEREGAGP